jgi:hypothetical protein
MLTINRQARRKAHQIGNKQLFKGVYGCLNSLFKQLKKEKQHKNKEKTIKKIKTKTRAITNKNGQQQKI